MSSKKNHQGKARQNTVTKGIKKEYSYMPYLLTVIVFTVLIVFFSLFHKIDDSEVGIMTVYKSPTCGCCNKWIDHLKSNGFKVRPINTVDMQTIKREKNIPIQLKSCHTAVINGYVIEGHVPADDILKLLSEKRSVAGLSVPNMPMGSPGMEGNRKDNYKVYEFDQVGNYGVINKY